MGERYLVSAHCYLGSGHFPAPIPRRKYEIIRQRAHRRIATHRRRPRTHRGKDEMTITLTIHAPDKPPSDKNTVIIWTTNGFSTWWQAYWDGARWRDPDTGDIINQDVTGWAELPLALPAKGKE